MGVAALGDLLRPAPPPASPTKLQVYFVGLGRTGTTSLASALSLLGYSVLHDDESPAVMDLYADLTAGKITEDELHAEIGERGFNCSFFYNGYGWAGKQDDVKVVLTTRDPEKWVDSWLVVADIVDVMAKLPFAWLKSVREFQPTLVQMHKEIPSGGKPGLYLDRDTLIQGYTVHVENVQRAVPKERLLEYSVKEGWEPLCQFLGVPVPEVPFPHVNDRLKIKAAVSVIRIIPLIWPLFVVLPLLLVGWLWRRFTTTSQKKLKKS